MIVGHQKIVTYLSNVASLKKPSHAYLFYGPKRVGKATVARWFSNMLLCERVGEKPCGVCRACVEISKGTHPDFYHIKDDNENGITIDDIRKLRLRMSHTSFGNAYKIAIIDPVHALMGEAANAFLKFLEEPPGKTIFILIAHALYHVIPTIISRAERVAFSLVSSDEIVSALPMAYSSEQKKFIARVSMGQAGHAIDMTPEIMRARAKDEKDVLELLNSPIDTQLKSTEKLRKRLGGEMLECAANLLRDAMIYKIGLRERVIRKYMARELAAFANRLELLQIFQALSALLAFDSDIRHNVNEELIWSALFLKLYSRD